MEVKGAVVDIRNRDRKTPLHNAAQFSQVPCIEYLISKGKAKLMSLFFSSCKQ